MSYSKVNITLTKPSSNQTVPKNVKNPPYIEKNTFIKVKNHFPCVKCRNVLVMK